MAKVMILGSGGFGLSLAVTLTRGGHEVTVWSKYPAELQEIRQYGEHRKLLPGVPVDPGIRLTTRLEEVEGKSIVLFAVPSFAVREVASALKGLLSADSILVNVGKGLEEGSCLRLSQVIGEELPGFPVVALSGPSHAEEIARGVPTTVVAACKNRDSARLLQELMKNTNLRIYLSDDMVGVELAGALKNTIALCAGICDGMGLGDNAKAALMTRGLAEISRLGTVMGAMPETFVGLAGMGDLIVTCTSMHSRNRRCGILIGQGLALEDAVARVGTVEGVYAGKTAYLLSQKHGVEMPITQELHQVLTRQKPVEKVLADLMGRPGRHENENVWQAEQNQY